jgi:hypothetical protein
MKQDKKFVMRQNESVTKLRYSVTLSKISVTPKNKAEGLLYNRAKPGAILGTINRTITRATILIPLLIPLLTLIIYTYL